jgi:hypothetical protein
MVDDLVNSVLGDTTIGEQFDAVDIAAVIRSEEDGSDIAFDRRNRPIKLGLAAAGDEHSSALLSEPLSGSEANADAAPSYNRYFAFKFPVHKPIYLCLLAANFVCCLSDIRTDCGYNIIVL